MQRKQQTSRRIFQAGRSIVPGVIIALTVFSCRYSGDPARQAGRILERSGVSGGLVVHFDCGDGRFTAGLNAGERYTVHGLDGDTAEIRAAQTYLVSSGLDGPVTVMHWERSFLPYSDNLVNLFISEAAPDVGMEEVMRVLVPGGVAMIGGKKVVKPWPEGMDEWRQSRYDHTNNGVSKDTVGPPKQLRWTAGPLHARSHEENSSTMAVVTSGGRVFSIQDEGLTGISDPRLPSQWRLVARDAFNGKLLWKRDIPEWGWQVWERQKREGFWSTSMAQRHQFPAGMERRLIARDDRVYMTLGYRAPVSVLDAATGDVVRTLDQTENTDEIVLVDDMLLVLQREVPAGDRNREVAPVENPSVIKAVDPESGKTLWQVSSGFVWQWSLVSDGERVFYYDAANERVHAADLTTGEPLWHSSSEREQIESTQYIGMTFIVHESSLIYMGPGRIAAFDTGSGDVLWTMKGKGARAPVSHNQPSMFVHHDLLWLGGPRSTREGEVMTGCDPFTGREVRTVEAGFLINMGHHYRCYPPRATDQFIIFPRRGAEFMDLEGEEHMRHDWLRGACRFGFIPGNGLLYVTPHPCFCYPGVMLHGFNALSSGSEGTAVSAGADDRGPIRGPAYGKAVAARDLPGSAEPWPMYRHNNARSGSTGAAVPAELERLWEADLGGRLTQPVAAGGSLYVSDRSGSRVISLDQRTGEIRWQFVAGAEVDSPPTYHRGLLLFGCTDGWLYCVDAASGDLAWKYRVAPGDRLVMDEGRLQSAWPVHGSVIVLDGIVYGSAGRSSFLDGGIYLEGLDVYSGAPVHRGHYEGPYPDLTERVDLGYSIEGALNDLLVTDGEFIYLRQNKFDLELNHIPVDPIHREPPPGTKGRGDKGDRDVGMHLFATGGMLDDSFWNRNFWMHSERWPGYYIGNQAPKSGQLVVFDRENTYAVKHYVYRNPHSPMNIPGRDGYLVYADPNETPVNLYDGTEETLPLEWLPTPIKVLEGRRMLAEETLDYPAVNFDKGPGFTRRTPPLWMQWHPVRFMAMSQAGDRLVLCGIPDEMPEEDPLAAFEGRLGARLVILDAEGGETLGVFALDDPPVFDGISIGAGQIYLSTESGKILCLGNGG